MNQADEVLIIILAIVLAVFLLLLIWALVYAVQIMRNVKHIVSSAEKLVDSAETVGEAFKNVSGPIALLRLINNLGKIVKKQRGDR